MNLSVFSGHKERVNSCLYTVWNDMWLTTRNIQDPPFTIKPIIYVRFHYPNKLNLNQTNINLWNMSNLSDFNLNFVANILDLTVDNIKAILYQSQTSWSLSFWSLYYCDFLCSETVLKSQWIAERLSCIISLIIQQPVWFKCSISLLSRNILNGDLTKMISANYNYIQRWMKTNLQWKAFDNPCQNSFCRHV